MFRKILIMVLIATCLLIVFSYFLFRQNAPKIDSGYQMASEKEQIIRINNSAITVEVADKPYEQVQGLSDRKSMDNNHGMLFIFPESIKPSFWMKDMYFALDMIWIDAGGNIVQITKNISPDTYPGTFQPPSPIKYVLEVNAGWSDKNKIKTGDRVSL